MGEIAKNIFWALGVFLIITGVFIIVIQPLSPTGAVIDTSTETSRISFFIGLAMIIGGIVITIVKVRSYVEKTGGYGGVPTGKYASKSERVFAVGGLEEISRQISGIQPDAKKVALVLDASAAIEFGKKNPKKFWEFLNSYKEAGAEIIIPDYVLRKEVLNSEIQKNLGAYAQPADKEFRQKAKRYLKETPKHQGALYLIPYAKIGKLSEGLSRREKAEIEGELASLAAGLASEGKEVDMTPTGLYNLLMRNGLVSKGDITVLSSALAKSRGRNTFILGRDMHLREAVAKLREEGSGKDRNLQYIEFK